MKKKKVFVVKEAITRAYIVILHVYIKIKIFQAAGLFLILFVNIFDY